MSIVTFLNATIDTFRPRLAAIFLHRSYVHFFKQTQPCKKDFVFQHNILWLDSWLNFVQVLNGE